MSTLCALMRNLSLSHVRALPNNALRPLLACTPNVLLDQPQRTRVSMKIARRIRGYPRPLRAGVVRPEPMKYGFRLQKPENYTTELLRIKRMGGRHPETGKVVVRTIGGGVIKHAYWVDYLRDGPEDGSKDERVYKIEDDGIQSSKVALVAGGETKRWIIATEGIQVGDIIKSTREIPRIPVRPRDGDAHPLGALPVGTLVHCIEKYPNLGAYYCRAAGSSAEIIRKVEGRVVLVLPSKLHVSLSDKCVAVVGQVSNVDRMTNYKPIGSPNRLRRMGKRPRTGFWHRKDGYCGRKIKRPPPLRVIPLAKSKRDSDYVL